MINPKYKCKLCGQEVKEIEIAGEREYRMIKEIAYICTNPVCSHYRVKRLQIQVEQII